MAPLQHVESCFGCSTTNPSSLGVVLTTTPDGAEGTVRFGPDSEGAPGLVHGGLLATFADEVMGYVQHGGNAVRVTRGDDAPLPTPDAREHRPALSCPRGRDHRSPLPGHRIITAADDGADRARRSRRHLRVCRRTGPAPERGGHHGRPRPDLRSASTTTSSSPAACSPSPRLHHPAELSGSGRSAAKSVTSFTAR